MASIDGTIHRRGWIYGALVSISLIGCIAGVILWGNPHFTDGYIIQSLFSWSLAYATFCILLEIETLLSAKKYGIPEEGDRCKSVSYVLTVILSLVFPAILVLRILEDNLNFPAACLGMILSYSLLAAIWFFMLLPYGYDGEKNILLSQKSIGSRHTNTRNTLHELKDRSDNILSTSSQNKNKRTVRKTKHGQDRLTITDQDWYEKNK